ncbi:MAG: hypothetical protein SGI72_08325 [Planctomycetota bacterium]|nr:hypothetical protein [Planctomycetota bacterium]
MKRVFRSTLDPLPRSLSTKGLVSLVLVVVLGTAVTVHRYLESSGHPRSEVYGHGVTGPSLGKRVDSRGVDSRGVEVRAGAAAPRASSLGKRNFGASNVGGSSSSSVGGASGCASTTAAAAAAEPTTPSAYEPQ